MAAAASSQPIERLEAILRASSEAPSKRMLIIVNPYATTVSDRLKNLVVYALRGRYEVVAVDTEARDHAATRGRARRRSRTARDRRAPERIAVHALRRAASTPGRGSGSGEWRSGRHCAATGSPHQHSDDRLASALAAGAGRASSPHPSLHRPG